MKRWAATAALIASLVLLPTVVLPSARPYATNVSVIMLNISVPAEACDMMAHATTSSNGSATATDHASGHAHMENAAQRNPCDVMGVISFKLVNPTPFRLCINGVRIIGHNESIGLLAEYTGTSVEPVDEICVAPFSSVEFSYGRYVVLIYGVEPHEYYEVLLSGSPYSVRLSASS